MYSNAKAASIRRALAVAAQHRQAGRLPQATAVCNEILKADPGYADAFYMLAAIELDGGKTDAAAALLSKAISRNPKNADYHNSLGSVLRSQGKLAEAMTEHRAALSLNANFPQAHLGMGNVHSDLRQFEQAQACYRKALELKPDLTGALASLGALLQVQGDIDAAVACYEKVIALNPKVPESLSNLGVIENDRGNYDAAIGYYLRALEARPGYADAHYNLGNTYKNTGRFIEAALCYEKVIESSPGYAQAYLNLGNLKKEGGSWKEALALYRKAVEFKPDSAEAWHNIGTVLREQRKSAEAEPALRRALELKPDFSEAYAKLANVLHDQGKSGEAVELYRKALVTDPDNPQVLYLLANQLQTVCEWKDLPALSDRIRHALSHQPDALVDPFELIALGAPPDEQLACANLWTSRYFSPVPQLCGNPAFAFVPERKAKLRIGYLSGDFRSHVVSILTSEMFELHDRKRFEIFGYSYGSDDGGAVRRRIERAFDRFVDIQGCTFLEAATQIHRDGIDLLVDLTGHTRGTRSHMLALRAAPVQVSYLGFPGTLGGTFTDYIIADRFVIPPESARFYVEKPVYLPHTYLVNDRTRAIGPRASRADHGLPADAFVFCCFNQSYKIMPGVFDVWMRILQRIPGSVLWLSAANTWAQANLKREAQARGIEEQRLVFAPRLPRNEDHLARIRLADLFLDTLPYNAHATASDALWAGLPVLTCAGDVFASRVAASLLRAIGLPELVTFSLEDYEKMAVELALDREKLRQIRGRLEANRDTEPLFDTPRFTAHLEKAYEMMWERYCSGLPANVIEVPAQ